MSMSKDAAELQNSARRVLTSRNVADAIANDFSLPKHFDLLEGFRLLAIQPIENEAPFRSRFRAAGSEAAMMQFRTIDSALHTVLERENRLNSYLHHERDDDPDLPPDPSELKDPAVAFRYGLKRLYRRQFEVTFNETKAGAWPLIMYDVLAPLDGKRLLLVEQLRVAVDNHADKDFLRSLSLAKLQEMSAVLTTVQADVYARLSEELRNPSNAAHQGPGIVPLAGRLRLIKEVIEGAYLALTIYNDIFKETLNEALSELQRRQAEAEARRQWDRFQREPREIPRSSDFVDAFDRNKGWIEKTC
jgi:hypothetical protein